MKKIRRALVHLVPTFILSIATVANAQSLTNPLTFQSIQSFVVGALQILIAIAIPIIGFFIVLAGFNFITARGNSSKLSAARQNFLYVIIGAALVLGAWALASLIGATVSSITS